MADVIRFIEGILISVYIVCTIALGIGIASTALGYKFVDNLCKSLHYIKPNQINIFAYSTIFFFMERYTDTINNIL